MIACLDMEGVLTPEIWINVAERTGIPPLTPRSASIFSSSAWAMTLRQVLA